jgi:DNA-binding NarL/FixJ family response regulator
VTVTLDGVEHAVIELRSTLSPEALRPGDLSPAEHALVEGLLHGRRNADLARERGTSRHTVANQLSILYRRLGVSSRTELVLRAAAESGAARPAVTADDLCSWEHVESFVDAGRRTIILRRCVPGQKRARGLTVREAEVVTRVARGQANKLVALELGLAGATVAVHVARAARKLGVASRVELILLLSALSQAPC